MRWMIGIGIVLLARVAAADSVTFGPDGRAYTTFDLGPRGDQLTIGPGGKSYWTFDLGGQKVENDPGGRWFLPDAEEEQDEEDE